MPRSDEMIATVPRTRGLMIANQTSVCWATGRRLQELPGVTSLSVMARMYDAVVPETRITVIRIGAVATNARTVAPGVGGPDPRHDSRCVVVLRVSLWSRSRMRLPTPQRQPLTAQR